jgi:hypothetical protein
MLSPAMQRWFKSELEWEDEGVIKDPDLSLLLESSAEFSEQDIARDCGAESYDVLYEELNGLIAKFGETALLRDILAKGE